MTGMAYKRTTFLAITALLAADPVFAQVFRAGVVAEIGAPTAPLVPAVTVQSAFALTPGVAFPSASVLISPSAPIFAARAPVVSAAAAFTPRASARAEAIQALSADNVSRISGEQAKVLSARALGLEEGSGAVAASPVAGRFSAAGPNLEPSSNDTKHAASGLPLDPGPRRASLKDRIRDWRRYYDLTVKSFWWYMYTHIKDMWPSYKSKWAKAGAEGAVAISRPRAFFTAMRVTGMSGHFYALGGSALQDELVIVEFRRAFARYFDGPGIGEKEVEALERFMARAKGFNAEKRAHTNMYKNIRDPLIRASTMRPDQLAAYFDSLLPASKEEATKEYQASGRMDATREAFLKVLNEALAEEDPSDPKRVRAAIVLGSFASGSAGPGSDFDVEALSDGANNARVPAFSKRLVERWTAAGYHKTNPVTVHDNASWPSWGFVNIVQTRHYIVVSPEAGLVARLSRQSFEDPAVKLVRDYTFSGRVGRAFQRAVVFSATLVSDLRAAFGKPPSGPGH